MTEIPGIINNQLLVRHYCIHLLSNQIIFPQKMIEWSRKKICVLLQNWLHKKGKLNLCSAEKRVLVKWIYHKKFMAHFNDDFIPPLRSGSDSQNWEKISPHKKYYFLVSHDLDLEGKEINPIWFIPCIFTCSKIPFGFRAIYSVMHWESCEQKYYFKPDKSWVILRAIIFWYIFIC